MRRRDVLVVLGAGALWPRFARAEPHLVAVLSDGTPEIMKRGEAALRQGLAENGFVEGPNLAFAARYAYGDSARLPALAAELAALKPNVIVTAGNIGAHAAHRAAPDVPVVAVFGGDPVAQGLFQSYARPEGMVTGLTYLATPAQIGKNLEILRDLVPGLRGIGFVFSPDDPGAVNAEPIAGAAAKDLGLAYAAFPIRSMEDAKAAFSSGQVDGMLIYTFALLERNPAAFVDLAIMGKKPVITIFRFLTLRGFIVSYGPDVLEMWRRLGGYAARLLAGAKPSDLPVEMPTKLALVINLKTAKALGLTVPQSILVRADEVIE